MIHASAAEKLSVPVGANALTRVAIRDLLQPFDSLPGAFYIVKDRLSRVIAISPEAVKRMGYQDESEVLGKLPADYLPPELAAKFCEDDRWVMARGIPRLGMVEMWFNPHGCRDWISTNKYPLRSPDGEVVGIIGILQNLDIREKRFAHSDPLAMLRTTSAAISESR